MTENRARVFDVIRQYNKATGNSCRFTEDRAKLINDAMQVNANAFIDGSMMNELVELYNVNKGAGFDRILKLYIYKHKADVPVEPELPEVEKTPEVVTPKFDTMDLLNKALANVIMQTNGDEIRNKIFSDFEEKANKFILENYGPINRKVTVEVGEVRYEFDEVLHEKFDTILKYVQMDEPVFLTGPAGTGKSVICKQVAKALNLDFYFSNAVTQEYKITGYSDAMGMYLDTQFYNAFKNGGLFMLDEMDASIPEVLTILNAAIANRYMDFPKGKDREGNEIGGFVEAHPNFRLIAAGNTFGLGADYEYIGRNQLDAATLDRFAMIEIGYDPNIEKSVANGDMELVRFADEIRERAKQNGMRFIVSYRAIGRIAKMQNVLPLHEVIQQCLLKNLRKDDVNTLVTGMNRNNKYVAAIVENLLK